MSVKLKTIELSGAALDWAVAKATRETMPSTSQWIIWDDYHPSRNWRQGGPLIETHQLYTMHYKGGLHPDQPWFSHDESEKFYGIGETLLIAACRAIVAAKFGEFIEIPEDLINSKESSNEQVNR